MHASTSSPMIALAKENTTVERATPIRFAAAASLLAIALLAAASLGAAAPPARARTLAGAAFSGKVCNLLKPSQLALVEVAGVCKPVKTATVPNVATIFGAFWGGAGNIADPKYRRLSVQIWKPANPALFATNFKKQAKGTPVKIGSFARADISSGGENLYILIHGYGVTMNLRHVADTTATNIGEIGTPMFNLGKSLTATLG